MLQIRIRPHTNILLDPDQLEPSIRFFVCMRLRLVNALAHAVLSDYGATLGNQMENSVGSSSSLRVLSSTVPVQYKYTCTGRLQNFAPGSG